MAKEQNTSRWADMVEVEPESESGWETVTKPLTKKAAYKIQRMHGDKTKAAKMILGLSRQFQKAGLILRQHPNQIVQTDLISQISPVVGKQFIYVPFGDGIFSIVYEIDDSLFVQSGMSKQK